MSSAPAEGHVPRSVSTFLHQWFVELTAGARVDARPAVLAVILQTGDIGTEKRGEFSSAASALTFIAHLIIQNVRFHLHLRTHYRELNSKIHSALFYVSENNEDTPGLL